MTHILNWLIFLPTIGAIFVLAAPARLARTITWGFTFAVFLISCSMFGPFAHGFGGSYGKDMQYVSQVPWIHVGSFQINWHVGIDGLSFPLIILTTLITWLSAWASWNFDHWNVNRGAKGFFALFLILETGVLGTFAAIDFFLFYIFWEVMLLWDPLESTCRHASLSIL